MQHDALFGVNKIKAIVFLTPEHKTYIGRYVIRMASDVGNRLELKSGLDEHLKMTGVPFST